MALFGRKHAAQQDGAGSVARTGAARAGTATDSARQKIAGYVLVFGNFGIVAISAFAIWLAADKGAASQMVFTAVLPLFGTWVGAVLAFYFSRDNLQTASDTTLQAVRAGQGLPADTPVTEAMTPIAGIKPVETVPDDNAAKGLKLQALYQEMDDTRRWRVPVMTAPTLTPLYVVRSTDLQWFAAIQDPPVAVTALSPEKTLNDLLVSAAAVAASIEGFVAVPATATLATARSRLGTDPNAKDVFVTSDGTKTGTVIGWLTDQDLANTL